MTRIRELLALYRIVRFRDPATAPKGPQAPYKLEPPVRLDR